MSTLSVSEGDEPIICTARLVLRPFVASDAEGLAAAADDPRVAEHLRDGFPSPYTLADAESWIAVARAFHGMGITRDGRVIGGIGLIPGDDVYRFSAEVGYWIGVDSWGQGFATEAVIAFCDHVFTTTRFTRLSAHVFDGNPASRRVLVKAGFAFEGVSRQAAYKRGRRLDVENYGRLAP